MPSIEFREHEKGCHMRYPTIPPFRGCTCGPTREQIIAQRDALVEALREVSHSDVEFEGYYVVVQIDSDLWANKIPALLTQYPEVNDV